MKRKKIIHVAVTVFLAGTLALHTYLLAQGYIVQGAIGFVIGIVALFYQFVNIMLDEMQ